MNLIFDTHDKLKIPTWCLIEIYQDLVAAQQQQDWSQVGVALECLAEHIKASPAGHGPHSMVLGSIQPGVVTPKQKGQFYCLADKPLNSLDADADCATCPSRTSDQHLCSGAASGAITLDSHTVVVTGNTPAQSRVYDSLLKI